MAVGLDRLDGVSTNDGTPGGRLRRLRMRAGFPTAVSLARELGIPKDTYFQHENGRNNVTTKQAKVYADFFGVPPDVILYGDDAVVYPDAVKSTPVPRRIRIIGRVDGRGQILDLPNNAERWLPDPGLTHASVLQAAVIGTDALAPVYYRNDLVFFERLARPLIPEAVNGREAVTSVDHARRMLGTLRLIGDDGQAFWKIQVVNRQPVTREVYRASRVLWIKRA
jgi:DNA-binding XRE family transcriptional regulator